MIKKDFNILVHIESKINWCLNIQIYNLENISIIQISKNALNHYNLIHKLNLIFEESEIFLITNDDELILKVNDLNLLLCNSNFEIILRFNDFKLISNNNNNKNF